MAKLKRKEIRDLRVAQQDGLCCYCRRMMGPVAPAGPLSATLEHLLQRGHPHRYWIKNMKAACQECNQRRGLIWSAKHLLPPICGKRQVGWFTGGAFWMPRWFCDAD